jgi:hypothetical protein
VWFVFVIYSPLISFSDITHRHNFKRFGQDGSTADDRYVLGPTKAKRIDGLAKSRAEAYARDLKEAQARHAEHRNAAAAGSTPVKKLNIDEAYGAKTAPSGEQKKDRQSVLALQSNPTLGGKRDAFQQQRQLAQQEHGSARKASIENLAKTGMRGRAEQELMKKKSAALKKKERVSVLALPHGNSAKQKGEELRLKTQYKKKERKVSVEIKSTAKEKAEELRRNAQYKKQDKRISIQGGGFVGRLKQAGYHGKEVQKKKRLTGLREGADDAEETEAGQGQSGKSSMTSQSPEKEERNMLV